MTRTHRRVRNGVAALLVVFVVSTAVSLTAANTVPASKLVNTLAQATIGPNDLKPAACAGITLNNLVVVSGDYGGSAANDLVIGGPGNQKLNGGSGNDCIVAGGGDDTIDGMSGTGDVCLGGPGTDTGKNCETSIDIP